VNGCEKNAAVSSANGCVADGNEEELTVMATEEIKTFQVTICRLFDRCGFRDQCFRLCF